MLTKECRTFTEYGKTVTVGDTLHMLWDNGQQEDLNVTSFSSITNQPTSADGRTIHLYYVDWDKSHLQN